MLKQTEFTTAYYMSQRLLRGTGRPSYSFVRDFSLFSALALTLEACGNSPNLIEASEGRGSEIPEVELANGQDSGNDAGDAYTNVARPLLDIKGPLNSNVTVKNKDTGLVLAEGYIDNSGEISLQLNQSLADGVYTLVAESEKNIGKEGALTLTIDSSAAPLVVSTPDDSTFQRDAFVNSAEISSFFLSGTDAERDAELTFYGKKNTESEQELTTLSSSEILFTSDENEPSAFAWETSNRINLEALNLAHGDKLTIRATQTDSAGNVSSQSNEVEFTADFVPPMLVDVTPVMFTFESDQVSIEFDEEITGTIGGGDLTINGTQGGGGGIGVSSADSIFTDGNTLRFSLVTPLPEGSSVISVVYSGQGLSDLAGNSIEAFTAIEDQIDIKFGEDSDAAKGMDTPEGLVFSVEVDANKELIEIESVSQSSGANQNPGDVTVMSFLTNDDTPTFVLTGEMISGSNIALYFGDKPVDSDDTLVASKLLNVGGSVDFAWSADDIMREPLKDGVYTFFAITMNQADKDGETEEYTLTVDTVGPSIISDPSGFVRTGETSFEVHFNEDAFYGDTRQKFVEGIASNIEILGSDNSALFSSGIVDTLMLIGEDVDAQTFTGFSFEIRSDASVLAAFKSEPYVRLALPEGTVEDRLGNANDSLTGSTVFKDFTPPKGEISGYNTNTLRIRFDKGAELVGTIDASTFSVAEEDGTVYTVDGMPTYDADKGVLTIKVIENIADKELIVTVPENIFKSYGLNWENNNIQHDVLADLRLPNPPMIALQRSDDTGSSSQDNVTSNTSPRIDFSLTAEDRGGTLEIKISGTLVDGRSYSETITTEIQRGGIYTLEGLSIQEGRYDIEATILDDFGRKSSVGHLTLPDGDYGYSLSGSDADLFDITEAGVLYFKDKASGIGNAYKLSVHYRDANGDSISQDVDVNVTQAMQSNVGNTAPVFDQTLPHVVRFESLQTGVVGTFAAVDGDAGDMVSFQIDGNDANKFTIDSNGNLSFVTPPDVNVDDSTRGNNAYQLTIIASDGKNETLHDLTVEVTAEAQTNTDPTFHGSAGVVAGTVGQRYVGEFYGDDSDQDKLFYSIEGQDSHVFMIDDGGVLYFREPPLEDGRTYTFRVTVSDGTSALFGSEQSIMIAEQDFQNAPSFASDLMLQSVFGGAAAGDEIGTFTASGNGNLMYELLGADKALFSIDNNGRVTFASDVAYVPTARASGDHNAYYFTVRAFEATGIDTLYAQKIEIIASNNAPNFVGLNPIYSVLGGNDKVVALNAEDLDGDMLTYSLDGRNADQFSIEDGVLRLRPNLDFNANGNNSYSINLTVSDAMGGEDTQALTVMVTENNTAGNTRPEFLPNTAKTVYTSDRNVSVFGTSDADGDNVTITLGTSGDEALFDLGQSGILTFLQNPDYENPQDADSNNVYEVTLLASDGMSEIAHDLLVYVENTPEATGTWMNNIDVEEGKTYVGSFDLADTGDEPKLIIDTTSPMLVSVVPILSFAGDQRILIQFDEDISLNNLDYSQFTIEATGNVPRFEFTMPAQLAESNLIELFLTSMIQGDRFRLQYSGEALGSIEDKAGNPVLDFNEEGDVLTQPVISSTTWSNAGTDSQLDDDIVTFKFTHNIEWATSLSDVLTNGSITWEDQDNPGATGTVDSTDYSVTLSGDEIEIEFMGVDLPQSDNIAFTFAAGILSLDIAGLPSSSNTNAEIIAMVDTKPPGKSSLDAETNTGSYSDLATDGYININERDGGGITITGDAFNENATLNVRIGSQVIENAIGSVSGMWSYTITDQDVLMNVMDGEELTVFLTDDSGNESPDSSNKISYMLDYDRPDLTAADAKALEGSDFIVLELSEALLTNAIETNNFSVDVNGTDVLVDDVMVQGSRVEISVDDMVSFAVGDMVSIRYAPRGDEADDVQDRAGNLLNSFDNKIAAITNAPVLTALEIADGPNAGEKNILLTFNNAIEAFSGSALDSADITLNGTAIMATPTITNGNQIEFTLSGAEVNVLETLDEIQLTLLSNTIQLVGTTDGNFEQVGFFDLKPPTGITVDLVSDTGLSSTDDYTNTAVDAMFTLDLGSDANDLSKAKVEVFDPTAMTRVGSLIQLDKTQNNSFEFDVNLPPSGNTLSKRYLLRVIEAEDEYGNTSTAPEPDLEVFLDDSVKLFGTRPIDFGGNVQQTGPAGQDVHYLFPDDTSTNNEVTLKIYFEEEDQQADLRFYYRFEEGSSVPTAWNNTTGLQLLDPTLPDNNFSFGTDTIGGQQVSYAEFTVNHQNGGFNDTNQANLYTFFQFSIVDKAGNVVTQTEYTKIATNLNLTLSVDVNTRNITDTGISSMDSITEGVAGTNASDRLIQYNFLPNSGTSWSAVDSITVKSTHYSLNTGALNNTPDFETNYTQSNGFTKGPVYRVSVNYQNAADSYFIAEQEFSLVNNMFGEIPARQRLKQTLIFDDVDPVLQEAVFISSSKSDPYTVNNILLFTSTDENDFVYIDGAYRSKTGAEDFLHLEGNGGDIEISLNGTQYTVDLVQFSQGSGREVTGGINIRIQGSGLSINDGDTITITFAESYVAQQSNYIHDKAGNKLLGDFTVVFDASKVLALTTAFEDGTNSRFTSNNMRNQHIVDVTPATTTPSIADEAIDPGIIGSGASFADFVDF